MRQEINLYPYLPKKSTALITPNRLLIIYLIFTSILFLDSSYTVWKIYQRSHVLRGLTATLAHEQDKLVSIVKQYPLIDPKDMENSMHLLQQELTSKTKIVSMLARDVNFADWLKAFAQINVPYVWLTQIVITEGGDHIVLRGQVMQSDVINRYVSELSRQSIFSHLALTIEEVTKAADTKERKDMENFMIVGVLRPK